MFKIKKLGLSAYFVETLLNRIFTALHAAYWIVYVSKVQIPWKFYNQWMKRNLKDLLQ